MIIILRYLKCENPKENAFTVSTEPKFFGKNPISKILTVNPEIQARIRDHQARHSHAGGAMNSDSTATLLIIINCLPSDVPSESNP